MGWGWSLHMGGDGQMSTPRKDQPLRVEVAEGRHWVQSYQEEWTGEWSRNRGPTHCVPTSEADANRVYGKTNMYVTSFYSLYIQGARHFVLIVCMRTQRLIKVK